MGRFQRIIVAAFSAVTMVSGAVALAAPAMADTPVDFTPYTSVYGQNTWINDGSGSHLSLSGVSPASKQAKQGTHLTRREIAASITDSSRWWPVVTTDGYYKFHEKSNYGLCWAQSSSDLIVANCSQGADYQKWQTYCQSSDCSRDDHYTIVNFASGKSVGVYGTDPGRPVYVENAQSGFLRGWAAENY